MEFILYVILNVSLVCRRRVSLDGEFQSIFDRCERIPGKGGDDIVDRYVSIMFSDQCPLLPKFLFVADKQFRSEDALRRSISNGEFISADVPKISSYGIEMKCINVAKISVKCKIYNLAAVCVYVCSRLVEILKNLIKN